MSFTRRTRKFVSSVMAALIGWTAMLTPFALVPAVVHAQEAGESTFSQGARLVLDLELLLDRAAYPNVPRRGASGIPGASELAGIQTRLLVLKRDLQNTFLSTLQQALDKSAEQSAVQEIGNYFESVKRFESLKVLLGQATDPSVWDAQYGLKFPIRGLAQMKFLETASFFAKNFTVLPVEGYDGDRLAEALARTQPFHAQLESAGADFILDLQLNPAFAEEADRMALFTRPGLKSGLQFAGLFAADRLYESQALTRALLRQDPSGLPEPLLRARFLSLKVKKQEIVRRYRTMLARQQKPLIYKSVLNAVEKSGIWVIDDAMMAQIYRLNFQEPGAPSTPEQVANSHKDELSSFNVAFSSLLNLMDVREGQDLAPLLLYEGKRLSLRWLFLTNAGGVAEKITPEARASIESFLDQKAREFTDQVLSKTPVRTEIAKALGINMGQLLTAGRIQFQERVEAASIALRNFEKQDISIGHLVGAVKPQIDALQPSPLVKTVVETTGQQITYEAAYLKYKEALLNYLSAFRSKAPLPEKLSVSELLKTAPNMQWNPQVLKGAVPDKYIAAMNEKARLKDLKDLVQVGKILKFDVYESLNGQRPTVANILTTSRYWFGGLFANEKSAYLEEVKKDLLKASPLLGGEIPGSASIMRGFEHKLVYEQLAEPDQTAPARRELVESQLGRVMNQITENEKAVAAEMPKIDAIRNDDSGKLSSEMLILATRASQISIGLESFASFASYYSQMRDELMLPGFFRKEWQQFSTWTGTAVMYMFGVMALQIAVSRFAPLGRAADEIGKTLAPVFGPYFSRLNPLFWGMFGITLSDQIYRGGISEPQRLSVLRRYFECGSGGPCVALYSDVKAQTDIMNAARVELISTVGMMALFIGGFYAVSKLISGFGAGPSKAALAQLKQDMATLGLPENASLSRQSIEYALKEALQKARSQSDPIARELGEVYVRQAYFRIESRIWQEAAGWVQFDARYAADLRRLGVDARNWKDMNAIAGALDQLETRYKNGQILTSDYQSLKNTLFSIYQKLSPLWQRMETDPLLRGYYGRVWDSTGGSSAAEISASRTYYDSRISQSFQKAMDEYYGSRSTKMQRLDALLERFSKDMQQNPETAAQRVQQLRQMLEKEAAK